MEDCGLLPLPRLVMELQRHKGGWSVPRKEFAIAQDCKRIGRYLVVLALLG